MLCAICSAPKSRQVVAIETNPRLEAALEYARLQWPVVPLHTPDDSGVCDCPKRADCESNGKHPRTLNGLKDSTTDEAKIRRWWSIWPHANVAIDLARAGLVDIAPDSVEWWAEFTARGLPRDDALRERRWRGPPPLPVSTTGLVSDVSAHRVRAVRPAV